MSSITLAGYTIAAPSAAPTAAVGTASGSLGSGTYGYNVTFVTPFGESTGATVAGTVATGASTSVNLTAIAVSTNTNVYQRKVYRTAVGGSTYYLLATINDNSTTTYADTASDPSINTGPTIPIGNTASSREQILGDVIFGKPLLVSVDNAVAISGQTQTQAGAYVLSKEVTVIASATAGDGCILPLVTANNVGMHFTVVNNSAGNFLVYPNVGQKIGSGGTVNAAYTIATTNRSEFVAVSSAGVWERIRTST